MELLRLVVLIIGIGYIGAMGCQMHAQNNQARAELKESRQRLDELKNGYYHLEPAR